MTIYGHFLPLTLSTLTHASLFFPSSSCVCICANELRGKELGHTTGVVDDATVNRLTTHTTLSFFIFLSFCLLHTQFPNQHGSFQCLLDDKRRILSLLLSFFFSLSLCSGSLHQSFFSISPLPSLWFRCFNVGRKRQPKKREATQVLKQTIVAPLPSLFFFFT